MALNFSFSGLEHLCNNMPGLDFVGSHILLQYRGRPIRTVCGKKDSKPCAIACGRINRHPGKGVFWIAGTRFYFILFQYDYMPLQYGPTPGNNFRAAGKIFHNMEANIRTWLQYVL